MFCVIVLSAGRMWNIQGMAMAFYHEFDSKYKFGDEYMIHFNFCVVAPVK